MQIGAQRLGLDGGTESGSGSGGTVEAGGAGTGGGDATGSSDSDGGGSNDGSVVGPVGDGGCLHVGTDGLPDCSDTLVLNADFNHDLTNWVEADAFGNSAWSPQDSQGRVGSGSIVVTNTYQTTEDNALVPAAAQQCIAAVPGKTYSFSTEIFIPSHQPAGYGLAELVVWFYTGTNCGGGVAENGAYVVASADKLDTWITLPLAGLPGTLIVPASAQSLGVRLVALKPGNLGSFQVLFDAVRVTEQD